MLKWAVTSPRQSYLQTEELKKFHNETVLTTSDSKQFRRKSSDFYSYALNCQIIEKENQMTSTPLMHPSANCSAQLGRSPVHCKLESLKDLSNIIGDKDAEIVPQKQVNHSPDQRKIPPQYASTLPSFNVEYSPCALVPGQLLALRGIHVADAYFEKPCYLRKQFEGIHMLQEEYNTDTTTVLSTLPMNESRKKYTSEMNGEENSLSSSKMGDVTLDRMIDAILESTRKQRKHPKCPKQFCFSYSARMSPTYKPAEDPASDLHEFWGDNHITTHVQWDVDEQGKLNEREIRSPLAKLPKQYDTFHLKRQCAVRRKRKMAKLVNSGKDSAQSWTELRVATKRQTADVCRKCSSSEKYTHRCASKESCKYISSDSGNTSFSDLEDGNNYYLNTGINYSKSLDVTKRRLSFSSKTILENI